jgi:FMN-dependent NADH-azoreductase
MTTILRITSSIYSNEGQSSRLAGEFVAVLRERLPNSRVIDRDLARDPIPHLDASRFQAFLTKPEQRTPGQQAVAAFSDALIQELRDADVIVLGLPMYNFGVPSQLKAWIDHVARAGSTFRYTERGPEGLLRGKTAYVFATRGGLYQGTAADTQTAYVRDFLRFIGITEVEFVHAEGLAISPASKESSLAQARATLQNRAGAATPVALAA